MQSQCHYKVFEGGILNYQDSTISNKNAHFIIHNKLQDWVKKGYLLASLDSSSAVDSAYLSFYLYQGEKYSSIYIDSLITDKWEDVEISRSLRQLVNNTNSLEKFNGNINKILKYHANNGYPFAHISLVNPSIQAENIAAAITFKKNQLVLFDTLSILSETKLSRNFIKNYLGIEAGAVYEEKLVKQIESKLKILPFLTLSSPPLILFHENLAMPILKLEKQKVNKVDVLAGFAPQSNNNNNKLLFTGQADIELHNVAGGAEKFTLFWQSFLKNSQSLKAGLSLPYLPYLSFGTDLGFEVLKFDSNFLSTKSSVAITYRNNNNTKFYAFYKNEQTSLLTLDTNGIRNRFGFPSPNATRLRQYGLGLEKQLWSNFFNPWKGFALHLEGGLGGKTIQKDNRIEAIKFSEGTKTYTLYDSLELNFVQANYTISGTLAVPIKGVKWVVYTHAESKSILAKQVFLNEVYRMGGFKTLRGFDEQAIFASSYALANAELRYRYDNLSNIFIFGNAMWYRNDAENFAGVRQDIPYGFGVGANINTGNTILSIAYAYGVQKNIPLNIARGKFHFGLVNYF